MSGVVYFGGVPIVRHNVINVFGPGIYGQPTVITTNCPFVCQPAHMTETTYIKIGGGRIMKTTRWSDGTYESWEGYYDFNGIFHSVEKTHYR